VLLGCSGFGSGAYDLAHLNAQFRITMIAGNIAYSSKKTVPPLPRKIVAAVPAAKTQPAPSIQS